MKRFFTYLSVLFMGILALGQDYTSAVTVANTPAVLVSAPAKLLSLTLTASTANITTFKFYDYNSATAARTNIIYAATVGYTAYTTNMTQVFTNEMGLVLTNTFAGLYREATVVAAVTNERPRVITMVVPASSQRTLTLSRQLRVGLVTQSDYAGIVEVEYDTGM
jgi:hypothetical protein